MQVIREGAQWAAGILIGASIGAILATGAAGSSFAPQVWFWYAVLACGLIGLGLIILYFVSGIFEERFFLSEALTVDFTGAGSDSVYDFQSPNGPATEVRLRVRNLRKKRVLEGVQVELVEIRRIPAVNPVAYTSWRSWLWVMHDNTTERPESINGFTLEAGAERYLGLATKVVASNVFTIDYAQDSLKNPPIPNGTYAVHVRATSHDLENRIVPRSTQAGFRLVASTDGGLVLTPTSLESLGFVRTAP